MQVLLLLSVYLIRMFCPKSNNNNKKGVSNNYHCIFFPFRFVSQTFFFSMNNEQPYTTKKTAVIHNSARYPSLRKLGKKKCYLIISFICYSRSLLTYSINKYFFHFVLFLKHFFSSINKEQPCSTKKSTVISNSARNFSQGKVGQKKRLVNNMIYFLFSFLLSILLKKIFF